MWWSWRLTPLVMAVLLVTGCSMRQRKGEVCLYRNGESDAVDCITIDISECLRFPAVSKYVSSLTSFWGEAEGLFYSEVGLLVSSCSDIIDSTLYFVEHDKPFFWPPVKLGYRRVLSDLVVPGLSDPVELQTLSISPRVFSVDNLISQEEAETLIERAIDEEDDTLQRSTVGRDNHHISEFRTGQTAWEADSPLAFALQKRALDVLRLSNSRLPVDATWIEDVQVLKYDANEYFSFHYDFRHSNDSHSTTHNYDVRNGGTDRFATVMFYLDGVEHGGRTAFPQSKEWWDLEQSIARKRDGAESPSLNSSLSLACDGRSGLAVPPRRLQSVVFYSQTPRGEVDLTSEHAGCPVRRGTKWLANVWVWNGPRAPYWLARQAYLSEAAARGAEVEREEVLVVQLSCRRSEASSEVAVVLFKNDQFHDVLLFGGVLLMELSEGVSWDIRLVHLSRDAVSELPGVVMSSAHSTGDGESPLEVVVTDEMIEEHKKRLDEIFLRDEWRATVERHE